MLPLVSAVVVAEVVVMMGGLAVVDVIGSGE
jgi:hypothetical protein